MDQDLSSDDSGLRDMISHPKHSLSHLNRFLAYEFEFTGIDSKFKWIAGESVVKEVSHTEVNFIDVSDVRQTGSVETTLKKVIKKVCRTKSEEEKDNEAGRNRDHL